MIEELSSSCRSVSLHETLELAKSMAEKLGITRVTDTTQLDKIGIPVYASIRPAGKSLCVNAGKGFTKMEAKVGAYMEAIEYALAEFDQHKENVKLKYLTFSQLEDQLPIGINLQDFCPKIGVSFTNTDVISCVQCKDITTDKFFYIPTQLIFVPYQDKRSSNLYGASTNGLASGNTITEASIHAVCELIERDIFSFNQVCPGFKKIDLNSLGGKLALMRDKIEYEGLELVLKCTTNQFNLPYFEAFILDEFNAEHITISRGQGLHLKKEIAAIRAIAEAVQSRLTNIHGGRDDIINRFSKFNEQDIKDRILADEKLRAKIFSHEEQISFDFYFTQDLPNFTNLEQMWIFLKEVLKKQGFNNIFQYILSDYTDRLKVVKVVIPKMEYFEEVSKRMGSRLFNFTCQNEN